MSHLPQRRSLRRAVTLAAVALLLSVAGLALNGFVHAHGDHGWHVHAGAPVAESPLQAPAEDREDDGHGHDLARLSLDLVLRAPPVRSCPLPDSTELPARPAPRGDATALARAGPQRTSSDSTWDPPPLIASASGTTRVLRASHSLRF